MTPKQIEGVSKARLVSNIMRQREGLEPFADNDAYIDFLAQAAGLDSFPISAADSYALQWLDLSIADLQAAYDAGLIAHTQAEELAEQARVAQEKAEIARSEALTANDDARALFER